MNSPARIAVAGAGIIGQAHIKRILEELSLDVASPDDARRMLKTKGSDRTAF